MHSFLSDRKYSFSFLQEKMRVSNEFELSFKEIQKTVNEENTGLLLTGGECTLDIYLDQTVSVINKVKANERVKDGFQIYRRKSGKNREVKI